MNRCDCGIVVSQGTYTLGLRRPAVEPSSCSGRHFKNEIKNQRAQLATAVGVAVTGIEGQRTICAFESTRWYRGADALEPRATSGTVEISPRKSNTI
jgi:hypothetical protein